MKTKPPRAKPGDQVVIVPGIMGSTLTCSDGAVLWSNDFRRNYKILLSNPALLAWQGERANGSVIEEIPYWFGTARLWGRVTDELKAASYNVLRFGYDWRAPLNESADVFAKWLYENAHAPFRIITHSMGGLLARVAVGAGVLKSSDLAKLVHVGAPLRGAPAAFSAVCGRLDLPLFNWIADLSSWTRRRQYRELLATSVQTFPSLFQMLPDNDTRYVRIEPTHSFNPLLHDVFDGRQKDAKEAVRAALSRADHVLTAERQVYSIYTSFHRKTTDLEYHVRVVEDPHRRYEVLRPALSIQEGDGTVPAAYATLSSLSEMPIMGVTHAWMCDSGRVALLVVRALSA